jgi:hypothetical protein
MKAYVKVILAYLVSFHRIMAGFKGLGASYLNLPHFARGGAEIIN